jgi:hypothetical protein
VQHVHAVAFTIAGHPCEWWYGDDYLGLDAVHRCHVVTHELGHLLGRPDGLGAAGDTLGVMGGFAVTPQCAPLLPAPVVAPVPQATVAAPVAVPVAAAPAPVALVAPALTARQVAVASRAAARASRERCIEKANRRASAARRRLGRITCRDRKIPAVPPKFTR